MMMAAALTTMEMVVVVCVGGIRVRNRHQEGIKKKVGEVDHQTPHPPLTNVFTQILSYTIVILLVPPLPRRILSTDFALLVLSLQRLVLAVAEHPHLSPREAAVKMSVLKDSMGSFALQIVPKVQSDLWNGFFRSKSCNSLALSHGRHRGLWVKITHFAAGLLWCHCERTCYMRNIWHFSPPPTTKESRKSYRYNWVQWFYNWVFQ